MIISASRRTDIPAFYAEWFMNRVRAGYCTVANPFNPKQVSYVSLAPEDVDVITFWTRNPRPLFPYLDELDRRGYRYYFGYTVLGNPRFLDPKSPSLETSLGTFRELAGRIGVDRVVWRYDPIVFTDVTDATYHEAQYEAIARALNGFTRRSIISLMDLYQKADKRLRGLAEQGVRLMSHEELPREQFEGLMLALVRIAGQNGMEIQSCAERANLAALGIKPGKCVDDVYIERVFGVQVTNKKDPSQRAACGCVISKDIGAYDTCLFGCRYCYATKDFERARVNHAAHNPRSPSLVGWYEAEPPAEPYRQMHLGL